MRRRAEADKSARSIVEQAGNAPAGDPIIGSALDDARHSKSPPRVPFEAPKRASSAERPARRTGQGSYEPGDKSFFPTSSEERAEQARRAAQRVRRRARGEDVSAPPEPNRDAQARPRPPAPGMNRPAAPRPAPVPERPSPATAKPEARDGSTIMDRAMMRPPQPPKAAPSEPRARTAPGTGQAAVPRPGGPLPKPTGAKRPPAPPRRVRDVDTVSRVEQEFATATPKPEPERTLRADRPAAPAPGETADARPPLIKRSKPKPTPNAAPVAAPVSVMADGGQSTGFGTPQSGGDYADEALVVPTSGIKTVRTKAFAAFEWMIASRYLRARKKEGFVSVIAGFSLVGIALGVATLIVVMAVMTGFRETLINQIIGGSPHINITSQVGPFENFDDVAGQIGRVDGVEYVTPVVQGQVLGTGNDRHTGVLVRGMRKDDLERLIKNAEPEVINGSLADFTEDRGLALGANLAAKLGLRIGDFITLISPDGDITPFSATPMPRVKDYKIIQTFKLGVQEIDYNVAFMPFGEAQIYFNKQDQADTLDVFVADAQNVEKYSEPIFAASRSSIGLYNWKNQNGRLIGAINLERQVMFVILTMIILVAALNIISGLVMLVKDKARDVAIMRTMGMARGSVLRIFFICGSSIGVIGSIAGVILGVLFVWNIHAIQGGVEWITGTQVWDPSVRAGISEIPTKLQFSDVALTLFIALGLSFIATLFPAWKAAKLDPVEALRYE